MIYFYTLKGSEGTFPACICGDGKVYVPERDECVVVDTSLCPIGAKKVNNKCVCDNVNEFKYEFDEIFWICRPWYLPTTHAPRTCPSHQHMVDGICEWDHCPTGYTGSCESGLRALVINEMKNYKMT